jgi:hypothetical protein
MDKSHISQQCDAGFIPEIAVNAAKFHASVRLERLPGAT